MLWLVFSSKLEWALSLSPLLKLPPRKCEPWFILLSLLCISINLTCNDAWNIVVMSWLLPLAASWKLQKWICRTVVPSLAAALEPLGHCQNAANSSLFYRYYFRCSSELTQLVLLPYSWGISYRYSDWLHDFSVTIPSYYKDVYVNSFFPRTAWHWNSLPIECFPLTGGYFLKWGTS